ncbi:MAG TPA: radical SAM protein [Sumerlaeia bacterium]|nr:radical SAM protein [Sumerlaeia bacterium]
MAKRRAPPRRSLKSVSPPTSQDLLRDETGNLSTAGGSLAIALAYPSSYAVGMSSLGFHMVRQQILRSGLARVERFFSEPTGARSLETDRPAGDFDLLAFSVAFELDYLHVLEFLEAAGLPAFAARRPVSAPLVVVGGIAVSVNRHPIYPFADLLVHGSSEGALGPLLEACERHAGFRGAAAPRAALLSDLAGIPGVEVTAGARQAVGADAPEDAGEVDGRAVFAAQEDGAAPTLGPWPACSPELDKQIEEGNVEVGLRLPAPPEHASRHGVAAEGMAVSHLVTPRAELGRRVLLELARGCPHACAFCWVGHNCGRFAPRPASEILASWQEASEITDCRSVGLISSAVGAHPDADGICEELLRRGAPMAFSSLRADEIRPVMLEALVRGGQCGLTLAPETGDEGLRRRVGKGIPDDVFFDAIDRAQRAGLQDLKLYFMTGLPGETEDQADRIAAFADRARGILQTHGRGRGRLGRLSINLGVYVPKPNTPLARRELPPFDVVRKRVARLARALAGLPNVNVAPSSADLAVAQRILSMGGFESAAFLHEVWRSGGQWRPVVRRIVRERKMRGRLLR